MYSQKFNVVAGKILLIFVFYTVAAASFNGFFLKWNFRDLERNLSFESIYDGTAQRPFVHRQLMITVAKNIRALIPEKQQVRLADHISRHNFIAEHYAAAEIAPNLIVEYHIVYALCFLFLLGSMFIWREICAEITGSKIAGTLTACVFAIIFPILETAGGYFYDFGELFFFTLAALFALKGYWLALILIAPIAEYNKESFLFFVATLFPLLGVKLGVKKSAAVTLTAIILSGLAYLYVRSIFAQNPGGATEFHLMLHLENFFSGWFNLEITYGEFFGAGMFLPHVLIVGWIIKNSWQKLSTPWKNHVRIAAAINIPLYLIFCWIGELRNLSMLYIGFMAMLAIFIKGAISEGGRTDCGTEN